MTEANSYVIPSSLSCSPPSLEETATLELESPAPCHLNSQENMPLASAAGRRRPIPRKGHTKSRNGCYNCKRRKVKCQENLPECYHCMRIGLACKYPPRKEASSCVAGPSMALQSTPTLFSMDDMRFFQHFLLFAYPALPVGGHEIWKGVAQLAHSVRPTASLP